MKLTKSQLMTVINEELEQIDEFVGRWKKASKVLTVDKNWNWEEAGSNSNLVRFNPYFRKSKHWAPFEGHVKQLNMDFNKAAKEAQESGDEGTGQRLEGAVKYLLRIAADSWTPKDFADAMARLERDALGRAQKWAAAAAGERAASAKSRGRKADKAAAERAQERHASAAKSRAAEEEEEDARYRASSTARAGYAREKEEDFRKKRGWQSAVEESKKITISQLQRIIQEEIENVLNK